MVLDGFMIQNVINFGFNIMLVILFVILHFLLMWILLDDIRDKITLGKRKTAIFWSTCPFMAILLQEKQLENH